MMQAWPIAAVAVALLTWIPGAAAQRHPAELAQGEQKVIKDPTEYNAYMSALNTTDPAKRGPALEAFAKLYPESVVRTDALEQAMAAYQQTNNQAGLDKSAAALQQIDADNIRALAILTYVRRGQGAAGDAKALEEARVDAERGLAALPKWPKPAGMSDADFEKLRTQIANIFNGAAGFVALQAKDYDKARGYYRKSVDAAPENLQDVYQLTLAELEMKPLDATGFWHAARATHLARAQNNNVAADRIAAYGRAKYRKFHGVECSYGPIEAKAEKQAALPPNFAKGITAGAESAALAVQTVKECEPASLSLADVEFVLGFRESAPANKAAADKVWLALLAKQKTAKLKLAARVVSAAPASLEVAVTDDNQQSNTADLRLAMAKPLAHPPEVGATVEITGVLADYKLKPFLFVMKDGEIAPPKLTQ